MQCEALICPLSDCPINSALTYVDGKCCKECQCKFYSGVSFNEYYEIWKENELFCKHVIEITGQGMKYLDRGIGEFSLP